VGLRDHLLVLLDLLSVCDVAIAASWRLTVPVVVQVEQLIAPLRYYSQCILEEGDDDQETADGRNIAVFRNSISHFVR
jgi:hypothetical protein